MDNNYKKLAIKIIEDPLRTKIYLKMGMMYHSKVEYKKAIHCYNIGLKLEETNSKLYCKLGLTYHNLGEHSKAIANYTKSIECNEYNAEATYYMGFILIQEGRSKEAIEYLERCIRIDKDLNPAYYYLGIAKERLGLHKEAINLVKRRIESIYPRLEPYSIFTLGELSRKRRRYKVEGCHTTAVLNIILRNIGEKDIHCFGDSHRAVFSNLTPIKCHNVGAGTAYNLGNFKSTSGAGARIKNVIDRLDPKKNAILLVFGEIDCMEHLYKNIYRKQLSIEKAVIDLATRYCEYAKALEELGYTVLIYGPSFSGYAINSYGHERDRNRLVEILNKKLKEMTSNREKIFVANINSFMIDEDYRPLIEMTDDGRHLDYFPGGSKIVQDGFDKISRGNKR